MLPIKSPTQTKLLEKDLLENKQPTIQLITGNKVITNADQQNI